MNAQGPAPVVRLVRLHAERDADLPLPRYMTPGAAGCDVVAAIDAPITLQSLDRVAVPTGLAMALPQGYEAQIRPRSGNALRCGLSVPNAPGTIDADYRGELKILLINLGREPITIERGDRIAQMIIAPVVQPRFELVESLEATARGDGGFGSTGHLG